MKYLLCYCCYHLLFFCLFRTFPPPSLPKNGNSDRQAQYTISTPLRREKPQKSPRVPPMLDIMSMVVAVAVWTICNATFLATWT